MQMSITVSDILQRKHFEMAQIVAGAEGLSASVKWVHVVEVTNIRNLLNGDELILSTGVAWKDTHACFLKMVEELIDAGAAGLCLELDPRHVIPQEIIDIADEANFPIILFQKEVPFVEITQDIHTLLINKQYQIISSLEKYSQQLNTKLLTIEHYGDILRFIHQYLHVQVILRFGTEEIHFTPEVTQSRREVLLVSIERKGTATDPQSPSISAQPIYLLGEKYAELIILAGDRALNEYDQLILDRTATALAQLLLRNLYAEEKKRTEEKEWLSGWLAGVKTNEAIREYLSYHAPTVKAKGAFVCIFKQLSRSAYSNADMTYFKLYFRAIFEQHGFFIFSIEERSTFTFIMLNERNASTWKKRMKEALSRLKDSVEMKKNPEKQVIGIGKFVGELADLHISYQTALETVKIQDRVSGPLDFDSRFYDDLHIFRLISLVNRHSDLPAMVYEYLEPVIRYDEKYNGKLLETLKTYLACSGSKQETASRLFIVRQTLYHRLQRLEKLLGKDFMNTEKRLALEFMILSYEYLQTGIGSDPKMRKEVQ